MYDHIVGKYIFSGKLFWVKVTDFFIINENSAQRIVSPDQSFANLTTQISKILD